MRLGRTEVSRNKPLIWLPSPFHFFLAGSTTGAERESGQARGSFCGAPPPSGRSEQRRGLTRFPRSVHSGRERWDNRFLMSRFSWRSAAASVANDRLHL